MSKWKRIGLIKYLIRMYQSDRILFSQKKALKHTWGAFLLELKFIWLNVKQILVIIKSRFRLIAYYARKGWSEAKSKDG